MRHVRAVEINKTGLYAQNVTETCKKFPKLVQNVLTHPEATTMEIGKEVCTIKRGM